MLVPPLLLLMRDGWYAHSITPSGKTEFEKSWGLGQSAPALLNGRVRMEDHCWNLNQPAQTSSDHENREIYQDHSDTPYTCPPGNVWR